jgi:hypothetical protein
MLVLMSIEITWCVAMRPRRNHGSGAAELNRADECIGVEGFVGDDGVGADSRDQEARLRQIMGMSAGQSPARQLSEAFHEALNFRTQPAARTAERLVAVFFTAPAACWWALTMVESRKTSSKSASFANSAKTRCHTPRSDQREKRLYALFHGPKLLRKSRHGEPVRAIHNTASTNKRLSLALTPHRPACRPASLRCDSIGHRAESIEASLQLLQGVGAVA